MRILLIAPASGPWRRIGIRRLFNGRTFRFSLLSLLTVAAETPPGCSVEIADEQVEEVPFERPYDLVGITCMTAAAPRSYEIAARFRERGVPVVLGGMHPSFLPEEALRHADAVCAGEAEGVWPEIVADARTGRLGGVYRAGTLSDLKGLRRPPRELLDRRRYATVQAVQATRGCPHRCAFCSVSAFHQGRHRCRPVEEVAEEVRALPGRFFLFVDDSLAADPGYARALFSALAPLGKRWMSQATLGITDDEGLVQAAASSGCVGLFVGLETFSGCSLENVGKGFNRVDEYRDRISLLHRHGIGVEAGVVFGFDGEGTGVFPATVEALEQVQADMVQISVLTPLPGTPQFRAMDLRITRRDWSLYDYHHVVAEPSGMSADDLQAGHDWATREFYRPMRVVRRLARVAASPEGLRYLPYAAAISAAYCGRVVRWGIRGRDPSASLEAGRPAVTPDPAWQSS